MCPACVAATPTPWHASRAARLPALHARLLTRQEARAFNQPLSFDTSKVTTMSGMFLVRSTRALAPTALSQAIPVHVACAAVAPRPPFDSAGRKLLVRRQQAAHPLRVGGQRRLRLFWLWLVVGIPGKLPAVALAATATAFAADDAAQPADAAEPLGALALAVAAAAEPLATGAQPAGLHLYLC